MGLKLANRTVAVVFIALLAVGVCLASGYRVDTASAAEGVEPGVIALKSGAAYSEDDSATDMAIVDGMAQPVFAYSDVHAKGYTNATSELYRFIVYVETDYDTDLDGKCDLVKTFVQVPRAAVEGKYRAPVIFRADPYSAGMRANGSSFKFGSPSVDDAALMGRPAHRTPTSSITTENLALDQTLTKASDWSYEIDGITYPSGTTSLDYYLVRGFATVQAAGLGTYGSEGIECCGTVMERDAFVDVVEWLHGADGRRAFADAQGSREVKATDWSSGHVGMTGLSYPGAMCYEVATSGVEGLDTVVPVAGPSSWYDSSNRQGISMFSSMSYNYTTVLADSCASRLFADASAGRAPDAGLLDLYQRYRTYLSDAQVQLAGDYGPYWAARDWHTGQTGMRASALIVTGLNDENVTTKHFDLMRDAFSASGCEVKVLLHQNGHVVPADEADHSDIMIGGHTYLEWLNLWFTRALLGEDNEAASLPDFTVQSNVDGSFYNSSYWNSDNAVALRPAGTGETTVHAKGAPLSVDYSKEPFTGKPSANAAVWTLPVTEEFTIAGRIPVHVRAKVDDVAEGDIPMCAVLLDVADEPFDAFMVGGAPQHELLLAGEGNSRDYNIVRWTQGKTTKKKVASGGMDLRNPEADYEPVTATKRAEPIQADTYYDYTIWLDPTYYTVRAGHRLELYVVPFLDYTRYEDKDTQNYMLERMGLDPSSLMNLRTDYSFTIEDAKSYAVLPVAGEQVPGGDDPSKPLPSPNACGPTIVQGDGATPSTESEAAKGETSGPAPDQRALEGGSDLSIPESITSQSSTQSPSKPAESRVPRTADALPCGAAAVLAFVAVAAAGVMARAARKREGKN